MLKLEKDISACIFDTYWDSKRAFYWIFGKGIRENLKNTKKEC